MGCDIHAAIERRTTPDSGVWEAEQQDLPRNYVSPSEFLCWE